MSEPARKHTGPHMWSTWWPWDGQSHYRYCEIRWCDAKENKKVGGKK